MNQPADPNEGVNFTKPESWGAPPPASGGYQPAPGGFQPAPGSYQPAPGGYQQAPGGYPATPYGGPPVPASPFPPGVMMASAGRRIGGFFLEFLLLLVTLGIGYLIWTLIVWANGQTPGKQVLKMRCYRIADQRAAHWGWMFLRQFIAGVLYEFTAGILFLVSAIMLVSRSDRRTLPDFIAGTVVLYDPNGAMR